MKADATHVSCAMAQTASKSIDIALQRHNQSKHKILQTTSTIIEESNSNKEEEEDLSSIKVGKNSTPSMVAVAELNY